MKYYELNDNINTLHIWPYIYICLYTFAYICLVIIVMNAILMTSTSFLQKSFTTGISQNTKVIFVALLCIRISSSDNYFGPMLAKKPSRC